MKISKKESNPLFKKLQLFLSDNKSWPILFLIAVSLIFIFPVFKGKIPLPADALVGAHTPWTELKWNNYPAGIPIKNLEITDSISQFYPWRSLVGNSWRENNIPLWDKYLFNGSPFLATWHSAALYPLNIFYKFLSDANTWTILIYLQILLAAVFTYLFLKSLGLTEIAAISGGVVFAFSGYMIAWLEFATGGQAGLWMPLLLFFELKLLEKNKNIYLVPIAIVFFFIFSAGDFQVPFYITLTYLYFGLYLVFVKNKLNEKENQKLRIAKSMKIISGLILGITISAVQLIPAIDLYRTSIRQADPYIKEYNFGLMDFSKALNFVWPDFFGNVVTRNYWGRFGFHEYLAFTGLIGLLFAVYSLIKKKNNIELSFWILLVISLLLLFPNPISYLPYKIGIPGLSTSSASRVIFLTDFCLAVLSGYGLSKWFENRDNKLLQKILFSFLLITSGVFAGLLINLFILKNSNPESLNPEIINNIKVALKNMIPGTGILILLISLINLPEKVFKHSRLITSFLILFLISFEMLVFANKNTPFSPKEFLFPQTRTIEFLQKENEPFRIAGPGIPLNYFMYYGISSAEGYDSLYPLENAKWYSAVNSKDYNHVSRRYGEISDFGSPLLSYANIKFVIDYKKNIYNKMMDKDGLYSEGVNEKNYKKVFSEGRVDVFENINYLPKLWLTDRIVVNKNESELLEEMLKNNTEKKIYLTSYPGINSSQETLNYEIKNFAQHPNEITAEIITNKEAMLYLSESYSKDWVAYVDGIKILPLRVNYLFMSVPLKAGGHEVHFKFDPKSFEYGKIVTFSTVFVLLAIFIGDKLKRLKLALTLL